MRYACIALVACLVAYTAASGLSSDFTEEQYEKLFSDWSARYARNYIGAEAAARFEAFKFNVDFVHKHNKMHSLGLRSYTVALNEYADMTLAEFTAQRNGLIPRNASYENDVTLLEGSAPDSVDWRQKGAVTDVKNQGQCGSCWSFSAIGAVEGAWAIKTGTLVSLSEQELVDCDKVDQGCNGGLMDNAFKWIEKNGGIDSDADYPYHAQPSRCNTKKEKKDVAKITGYKDVQPSDEDQLKLAVAQQPVAVAIEADQSGFQLYSGGVFDGTCGTQLDHGVLAVGYGTDAGQDYWIVKNSWGAAWGEQGYIRLARNIKSKSGQCGIAMQPSYPTE